MSRVQGHYKVIGNNGKVVEKDLNGEALFYLVQSPDGDETRINGGLVGDVDMEDIIKDLTEMLADTIDHVAHEEKGYSAPLLYHRMIECTAKAIGRHATEKDQMIMAALRGDDD